MKLLKELWEIMVSSRKTGTQYLTDVCLLLNYKHREFKKDYTRNKAHRRDQHKRKHFTECTEF